MGVSAMQHMSKKIEQAKQQHQSQVDTMFNTLRTLVRKEFCEKLGAKQAALQSQEGLVEVFTRQRNALQKECDKLNKSVAEANQVNEEWKKVSENLKRDFEALQKDNRIMHAAIKKFFDQGVVDLEAARKLGSKRYYFKTAAVAQAQEKGRKHAAELQ